MICQISKISSLPLCPPIVYSLFPRIDPRSVSRISLFQSLLSDRVKLSDSVVPLFAIYFSRRKPAVRACWLRVNQVSHRFGLNKLSRGKWGNRVASTPERATPRIIGRWLWLGKLIGYISDETSLSFSFLMNEKRTKENVCNIWMYKNWKRIREGKWIFEEDSWGRVNFWNSKRERERKERGIFGQKIVLEESSLSLSLFW